MERHTKTWRDSLPVDMLLSAVSVCLSVLVVVQRISEVPEGLMNYPVLVGIEISNTRNSKYFPFPCVIGLIMAMY